jgi:membrane-associated phospholipid phosphatase
MAAEEVQRPTTPPPEERLAGRLAAEEPRRQRIPRTKAITALTELGFPSGHAASGFAFANAVGQTLPTAAAPLRLLASVVGYSRLHTGVHYAGDVVMGATIGASIGDLVGWGLSRRRRPGSGAR